MTRLDANRADLPFLEIPRAGGSAGSALIPIRITQVHESAKQVGQAVRVEVTAWPDDPNVAPAVTDVPDSPVLNVVNVSGGDLYVGHAHAYRAGTSPGGTVWHWAVQPPRFDFVEFV